MYDEKLAWVSLALALDIMIQRRSSSADTSRNAAKKILISWLSNRLISASGIDHKTQERVVIAPDEWSRANIDWHNGQLLFHIPPRPGNVNDGVTNHPPRKIRAIVAVRINRKELSDRFARLKPRVQIERQKPGVKSLAKFDEPHVREMHELLQRGKVQSVHAAAQNFAHKATGGGIEDSKVRRLSKRYREMFGSK